jgi:hypothetical protein
MPSNNGEKVGRSESKINIIDPYYFFSSIVFCLLTPTTVYSIIVI